MQTVQSSWLSFRSEKKMLRESRASWRCLREATLDRERSEKCQMDEVCMDEQMLHWVSDRREVTRWIQAGRDSVKSVLRRA